MPSLHFSVKLKIYCDFVVKLLVDLLTTTKFTYVNKNNNLLYLIIYMYTAFSYLGLSTEFCMCHCDFLSSVFLCLDINVLV